MAPIAVLHCIITFYDLSRPLRLTYCTIISLSLSFIYDRRRLKKMGYPSLRKIPRVPEGRRIEIQIQSFPFLVWLPDRELKTGSRRLIITYTQCARPRFCFCSCLFS